MSSKPEELEEAAGVWRRQAHQARQAGEERAGRDRDRQAAELERQAAELRRGS